MSPNGDMFNTSAMFNNSSMYTISGAAQDSGEEIPHNFVFQANSQPSSQSFLEQPNPNAGVDFHPLGNLDLNDSNSFLSRDDQFTFQSANGNALDPFADPFANPFTDDDAFWHSTGILPENVPTLGTDDYAAPFDNLKQPGSPVQASTLTQDLEIPSPGLTLPTSESPSVFSGDKPQGLPTQHVAGSTFAPAGLVNNIQNNDQITYAPQSEGGNSLLQLQPSNTSNSPPPASVLGSSILDGFTDDVKEFDEEGALKFFYTRHRKVEPKGGLVPGALDEFINDRAGMIKKIKHAITHVRDLPANMSDWTLEDEMDALMIAMFKDSINTLVQNPDEVFDALATMTYHAFINLVTKGDRFNNNAMPNHSQFFKLDNDWTPKERFNLILKGLSECKTLARHLLDGQDAVAQFVAGPHSRFKAVYQTTHSNAVKQQRTDEARMAREAKEGSKNGGTVSLADKTPPAEDEDMLVSDDDVPAKPAGKTRSRKQKPETEGKKMRTLLKAIKRERHAAQHSNAVVTDPASPLLSQPSSGFAQALPNMPIAPAAIKHKTGTKRTAAGGTKAAKKRRQSKPVIG